MAPLLNQLIDTMDNQQQQQQQQQPRIPKRVLKAKEEILRLQRAGRGPFDISVLLGLPTMAVYNYLRSELKGDA